MGGILTPHGQSLSDKIFVKVNYRDYSINVEEDDEGRYLCTVQKFLPSNKSRCWFPQSYDDNESLFGGCSCGNPFTSG